MVNKRIFGFLFTLVMAICLLSGCAAQYKNVNANQFNRLSSQEDIQLVDVRTIEEYEAGHIKGAANINVQDSSFRSEINKLDKNKAVLVYCRSGKRSNDAAEIMKEAGFTKIVNLEGGILSWEEAAMPINK